MQYDHGGRHAACAFQDAGPGGRIIDHCESVHVSPDSAGTAGTAESSSEALYVHKDTNPCLSAPEASSHVLMPDFYTSRLDTEAVGCLKRVRQGTKNLIMQEQFPRRTSRVASTTIMVSDKKLIQEERTAIKREQAIEK